MSNVHIIPAQVSPAERECRKTFDYILVELPAAVTAWQANPCEATKSRVAALLGQQEETWKHLQVFRAAREQVLR